MTVSRPDTWRPFREASHLIARPFRWTTPNQLTFFGLLLTAPMTWSFMTGRQAFGTALFVVSMLTDLLDGALARAQSAAMTAAELAAEASRHFLVRRGPSEVGSSLDPFADKVRYLGVLLPIGWLRLNQKMIVASLALAFVLTVARPVFIGLARRIGRTYHAKSNVFGKVKAWTEVVLIFVLLLPMRSVQTDAVGHVLLAVALVTAAASFIRQVRIFLSLSRA